jgi:hypothetical protein
MRKAETIQKTGLGKLHGSFMHRAHIGRQSGENQGGDNGER